MEEPIKEITEGGRPVFSGIVFSNYYILRSSRDIKVASQVSRFFFGDKLPRPTTNMKLVTGVAPTTTIRKKGVKRSREYRSFYRWCLSESPGIFIRCYLFRERGTVMSSL